MTKHGAPEGMIGLSAQQPREVERLDRIVADPEAFRDWYDRVMPRVYRYLAVRCAGDTSLAEELTQQTFVQAIRHRDRFDGRADSVTWLCAIGRNRLVDHFRRHGRDSTRHLALVDMHRAHRDLDWQQSERRDQVQRALVSLPADQRLALVFRYLDDLPVRDVAAALGRTEKATESLLSRARDAFRRAYGGQTDA